MRVALIADIHGNLISLDAVLADIKRQRIDQVVCLGDVASLGPQPHEVLVRLRALGCPCVSGNHDDELLDPARVQGLGTWFVEVTSWCLEQLSAADLDYIRSFVPLVEIPLEGGTRLCGYHGSPRSNEDRILATTPDDELDEMLAGHSADVMVGAHNHVQMARRHRGMYVVEVGSVGLPFEQFPWPGIPPFRPWAEYAIVSRTDSVLSVDLRRVSVDLSAIQRTVLESGMPGAKDLVG